MACFRNDLHMRYYSVTVHPLSTKPSLSRIEVFNQTIKCANPYCLVLRVAWASARWGCGVHSRDFWGSREFWTFCNETSLSGHQHESLYVWLLSLPFQLNIFALIYSKYYSHLCWRSISVLLFCCVPRSREVLRPSKFFISHIQQSPTTTLLFLALDSFQVFSDWISLTSLVQKFIIQ